MRGLLLLTAALFAAVLYVATLVKPYGPGGEPLRMASHESLGLPPCNFKQTVTDLTAFLNERGIESDCLHGDLEQFLVAVG